MSSERRIIICVNSAADVGVNDGVTVGERNHVTYFLENKDWQVWHWLETTWLVIIPPQDSTTPVGLRKELESFLGKQRDILIMEVSLPIKYSGRGVAAAWPWMSKNWGIPQ